MIIRRRHTANFTTIGNALFEDERLAADEVGILAYLLSRPHDWEVRRPALMRRWDIGPVSMKRVINNLMRTGWCQAKKTRLPNGTFHIVYEIRDEAGPALSDDEIKAAFSLVSSEAGDDESTSDKATDHPMVNSTPPPCQPGVVAQGVVGEGVAPKKELLNTDSTKTESTQFARGFADVVGQWPPENILSSVTAASAYAALTDIDQIACDIGMRPYLGDCRAQNRKVCDLTKFIRERRWERFTQTATQQQFFVALPGTAQWFRWREYKLGMGHPTTMMDELARQNKGLTTPTEWPPPIPKTEAA